MELAKRGSEGMFGVREDGEDAENRSDDQTVSAKVRRKAKEQYQLHDFHACPEYMKDNEFILRYYRVNFSLLQALSSLFKLHNETLNIWTHLLGFLLFLFLTAFTSFELGKLPTFSRCIQGVEYNDSEHCLLQSMKTDLENMMAPMLRRTDRWPFYTFMGGSMFCLLASAVCHLFTCHSKLLAVFLMRIDYAGIATMIATSYFPPVYYAFQCDLCWQWIYLSTISAMGMFSLGVLFAPALQSSKYRPFRAILFMSMGASGLIPAIHGAILHWNEPMYPSMLLYEAMMMVCYAMGTVIYVARIPERWKPGLFDLAGHSHSIFHIFVIAGAYVHYQAALLFLKWRDLKKCDLVNV